MLQCIAVDDEPLALTLLEDNISKLPFLHLVAKCNDAFEATKILQDNKIDLIFIDIQMPGLSGLQFISSLQQKPMVILITAYKQYALEGYALDVIDYLVKPVPMDRFVKACNKAWDFYQLKNSKEPPGSAEKDFMFINVDYSLLKVMLGDIKYIEGLRDYIKIHLISSPKPVITRMSVSTLEETLPPSQFIRVHKSYIISVGSITSIRKNSVFINDLEIPVGATFRNVISHLTGKNSL
jgi:DNA-binding LytR/AlgR family response regulator